MSQDPNVDRNDPMLPEYWALGEDVQDRIARGGFVSETVEGIAVDVHDILQAAGRIREELAPAVVAATTDDELIVALQALSEEFRHLAWHGVAAQEFIARARTAIERG